MVESSLTPPCRFPRFPSLSFGYHGCYEILEAGQPPIGDAGHFASLGFSESSIFSTRVETWQVRNVRAWPDATLGRAATSLGVMRSTAVAPLITALPLFT